VRESYFIGAIHTHAKRDEAVSESQSAAPWYIVDVMPKEGRPGRWIALLTDVDPDGFRAWRSEPFQTRWLELGGHETEEGARNHAEQLLASRH
jgi:hypothetical protein